MQLSAGIALVALLLGVGWGWDHTAQKATIAELKAEHAQKTALAETAARVRLQQAVARGDVLLERLAKAELNRQTTEKETQREIKRLTTGRACLGGSAVRLLNASPGVATIRLDGLPAAAGNLVAADATFATDADVGQWAVTARSQYEQCRKRLETLIAWHGSIPIRRDAEPATLQGGGE